MSTSLRVTPTHPELQIAGPEDRAVGAASTPRRLGGDAVSGLTLWLALALFIPSPLIVKTLGASGTPANILGTVFLAWWGVTKLGTGTGIARGRQPIRIALLLLWLTTMASLVALYARDYLPKEGTGAERGLFFLAAMSGVALVAADGITSVDRLHTLMRRVVHGTALVAVIGIFQFATHFNPGRSLSFPGLTRNLVVYDQGRLSFVRVQATALHPIELGAVLGMVLPVAVHYALIATPLGRRRLAWLEVALIAAVLPMALTRTGVVVASVGMLALALDWTWKRRLRAVGIGVVFLAVMEFVIPKLLGAAVTLFTRINQDNSTIAREQRYGIAGRYFLQHPWFGRGFNTLYPATHQIFDNAYLYTVTETGAVGLAAVVLLFLIPIFTARGARLRSTDPAVRGLAQALAGCFAGTMIAYATSDMMSFPMATGLLFLFMGVAGALWRLHQPSAATEGVRGPAVAQLAG